MRFAFIAMHRSIWLVAWLCDALDVSRSAFNAWLNRSPSARSRHEEVLVTAINRSFKSSDRSCGARRVWLDVLAEGLACGLRRVERLMRENGLRARPRRRGLPKVQRDNLDEMISALNDDLTEHARADEAAARFTSITGIGVLGATALVAAIGDDEAFRQARDLPAWLGLVLRQMTTGGKPGFSESPNGGTSTFACC